MKLCAPVSPARRCTNPALDKTNVTYRRLTVLFAAGAVVSRVLFWVVTRRVWEDALVTLSAARNLWLGNGPVHHTGDGEVQSFTSPLGLLVAATGESVGQGLLFVRLVSLVCSVVTIAMAARISERIGVKPIAAVAVLAFLAFDQLQIMFGMAGMETQVATAVILACWLMALQRRWSVAFLLAGLAVLCRPEFGLFSVALLLLAAVRFPESRSRLYVALVAAVPVLAVLTLWTGDLVPNTIFAKSLYPWSGLQLHDISEYRSYVGDFWKPWSPLRSYNFTVTTPFPPFLLQLAAVVLLVLALVGMARCTRENILSLPAVVLVIGFVAYEIVFLVPRYFMWYVPPIAAIVVIFAGAGLSRLSLHAPRASVVLVVTVSLLYAVHIPFTFPLERRVQDDIEEGVRTPIGRVLGEAMQPGDTVVLEPPGFIGWAAGDVVMYDYPGLTSRTAVSFLAGIPRGERTLFRMIQELDPTYVVLRRSEYEWFTTNMPNVATRFEELAEFKSPEHLDLEWWGVRYFSIDTDFVVLRRHPAMPTTSVRAISTSARLSDPNDHPAE